MKPENKCPACPHVKHEGFKCGKTRRVNRGGWGSAVLLVCQCVTSKEEESCVKQ